MAYIVNEALKNLFVLN